MSIIEEWYELLLQFVQRNGWYILLAVVAWQYIKPMLTPKVKDVLDAINGEDKRKEILDKKKRSVWAK